MSQIAAVKAQAQAATVTFDYDGHTYTIEKIEDPSIDLLEALEDGRVIAATKLILGAEQYAQFKSSSPRVSDLNDLISKAVGTDAGKSGA